MNKAFWQSKSLFEMTSDEWEDICDGCGKCCLQQLEDDDVLVFTNVACDLLDQQSCRCGDYENRSTRVPDCMTLNKDNVQHCAEFAPSSCAYRLLLQGQNLPDWHHLVSGDRNTIHQAGKSVKNRVVARASVADEQLEQHIVNWPEQT